MHNSFCLFAAKIKIELGEKEDQLEVLSIKDDEDNEVFLEHSSEMHNKTSESNEKTPYSIMDAATPDTSFVLEPVREEQHRQNKLSRFRTPLNQQKNKDSNHSDTNPSSINSCVNEKKLKTPEFGLTHAGETTSTVPAYSQHKNGNSLALKRMDASQTTQDGTTKITMVQSTVTSFANNIGIFEPELVLSPAKLGQQ